MHSWMQPIKEDIGKVYGKLFTVRQVAIIFDKFGAPGLEYCFN
jgi:hypothetical protein